METRNARTAGDGSGRVLTHFCQQFQNGGSD